MRAETGPSPSESAAGIGVTLIDPVASPAAVRFVFVDQQGRLFDASHCAVDPVGDPPGHEQDRVDAALGEVVLDQHVTGRPDRRHAVAESVSDWLNSKSMFVVPEGSCTRCQNRFRNLAPEAVVSR